MASELPNYEGRMKPDNAAVRVEHLKKRLAFEEAISAMRPSVLKILVGGLWHTTSEERYKSIIECGSILVDPKIPDSERWVTNRGSENYPYTRTLGGVSLFDFEDFDPDQYDKRFPSSSWREFVPICKKWQSSIWIEIDKDAINDHLISGPLLLAKWKKENAQKHNVMPHIEAAHIGDISTSNFLRRFLVNTDEVTAIT